jgi:hypothetical protein
LKISFEARFKNTKTRINRMEEIEVKILEVNRKELEKKLIKLGAKKTFEGEISATFFDFKDRSIKIGRAHV